MRSDPEKHQRRSIRLPGHDYSQEGAYFVTVCTHNREMIFEDEQRKKIVEENWFVLPQHYPHVELDEFVVMPNHIHGIIVFVGAGSQPALPRNHPGQVWNLPLQIKTQGGMRWRKLCGFSKRFPPAR